VRVFKDFVGCYNVLGKKDPKFAFVLGKGETTMGNQKTIGIALLAVGVIVLFVSLGADVVGLGEAGAFGYKQIIGTVVGVIVAVVGFVLYSRK